MALGDKLFIVVPCYNEQEVLPETSKRLRAKMKDLIGRGVISPDSRVLFVDDGSKDDTWKMIEELHAGDPLFTGVKEARNRGHQNALLCGLMTAMPLCDVTISMDADLQDDIDAVDRFLEKYNDGCDVVYGIRSSRATDTFFKRFTAEGYYKFMEMMGAKVVFNHADYRLMSRRALEAFSEFKEVNLFLRGMVPMVGFPSDTVEYVRNERFAGESKYPLKKMLALAMNGITSFSMKPITLITGLGIAICGISCMTLLVLLILLACKVGISGFAFGIISLWLLGGIILAALGIVGEYVGRTYMETKARPRYTVEKFLGE